MKEMTKTYLAAIEKKETGIVCNVLYGSNKYPHEVIFRVAKKGLRPHHDGVPRKERCRGTPDRQRGSKGAALLQHSGAGVPWSKLETKRR